MTVLPHDESGKEEHADAACGSMHATWAHATREGHFSLLFFSAGFGFFQLFMWVNYYSILDTSWPTENVVTLFLLYFGGWFYGYLYDREGTRIPNNFQEWSASAATLSRCGSCSSTSP